MAKCLIKEVQGQIYLSFYISDNEKGSSHIPDEERVLILVPDAN
jgi:hypothetical protein